MEERIIIIHGYSDCSTSFAGIKEFLIAQGNGSVNNILYADYQSREDSLTFNDVADGLNDALVKSKLISRDGTSPYQIKIIVHSTGGLVVRHWLWRYYYTCGTMDICPVTNIVMLAPANFGSPLAHRGKSFLGSLVKGRWKVGDFLEVGKNILDGLELASPFQWELAHRDLLIEKVYFTGDKIKTTILVGAKDYDGIRGWVNKPGTDGTVVISGTNLDAVKLTLEFANPEKDDNKNYLPHRWKGHMNTCDIAFGVIPGYDHGSIVEEASNGGDVSDLLLRGLSSLSEDFKSLKTELTTITNKVYSDATLPQYQQFVIHAVDDYGLSVNDFSIEFLVYKKKKTDGLLVTNETLSDLEDDLSRQINNIITAEVHQNDTNKSFRRLLINLSELQVFIEELKSDILLKDGFVISMKVYVPKVIRGIEYDNTNLQNIVIYDSTGKVDGVPEFFFPNTTTLIELQVDRFNEYVSVSTEAQKHD